MRIATYLDAGDILALDLEEKYTLGIVERLQVGRSISLLDDSNSACVTYDPLWGGKWTAHILSESGIRGKGLWNFAHETALWMIERQGLKYLLIFADAQNFILKSFILYYKLKKETMVGKEALYIVSAQQILNFGGEV